MRKRPRWRIALTVLGALSALLAWTGYFLTRVPAVQRALTLREHRELMVGWNPGEFYGGWGWAERRQLHLEPTGSWLLKDPQLVTHRIKEMKGHGSLPYYPYAGEWALLFAAKRLQGLSVTEILGGDEGLTLGVATLVAEADPPNWWGQALWLQKAVNVQPDASFKLGLLRREDVSSILSRLQQCDERQTSALVAAVLRHQDAFSPEQRDAILKRWLEVQSSQKYANQNNVPSLIQALEARQKLKAWLGQPDQPVRVGFTFQARLSALQRHDARETLMDFLRSLGHQPILTENEGELEFTLSYTGVEFKDVTVQHSEQYTTTRRVARRSYSRYSGTTTTYEDKSSNQSRWVNKLESSEAPTLVVKVGFKGEEETFTLPPFGDFNQSTRDRVSELFKKEKLDAREQFTWNWCFENYALAPWRFGLKPYRHEWTLQESS